MSRTEAHLAKVKSSEAVCKISIVGIDAALEGRVDQINDLIFIMKRNIMKHCDDNRF